MMIEPAKLSLGQVVLNVNNLELQTSFYQQVIGLKVLSQTDQAVDLGVDQTTMMRLVKTDQPAVSNYGLYHTAILLPDRVSLATVFKHLINNQIPLQGGSDHGYSEAIYLEDTEGNGIELYRDKPIETWDIREDGRIVGQTVALDAGGILELATEPSPQPYQLPSGTIVGHVHLSVKDAVATSQLYQQVFGFDDKLTFPSASFVASGTYHHHLAFNQWAGQNLDKRQAGQPGLAYLTLTYPTQEALETVHAQAQEHGMVIVHYQDKSLLLEDPNGIRILVQIS